MLTVEVRIRIWGDDYYIIPTHRIPVEVLNGLKVAPEGALNGCIGDSGCMRQLQEFLEQLSATMPMVNMSDDRSVVQLARGYLYGTSARAYLVRRQDLMVPNTTKRVLTWIDLANNAQIDPYSFLSYQRTLGSDTFDDNLSAAERYFEGYNGNYGKFLIAAQTILKMVREIKFGKYKPAEAIFGRNGAQSPEFVTRWGMLGVFDREQGIKPEERVRRGDFSVPGLNN
jgi:hypothetical protein